MKRETSERIQIVILAAGRGERLRPLTDTTPKPLLAVGGTPIIFHTLEAASGIANEFIIVVGYLGNKIQQAVGAAYKGIPVRYAEQKELRGTADALAQAQPFLDWHFLVLNGDDLYAAEDIASLAAEPWAVLATTVADPRKYGVIERTDDWLLTDIIEQPEHPPSHLINCGAYVLQERFFAQEAVAKRADSKELGLPQTLVQIARSGTPVKVIIASFWRSIGCPEDLENAEILFQKIK